jgi:8-oxo-dGTP diphosphatase
MPALESRERPAVTVDIVTVVPHGRGFQVLLVKRERSPFADCWALPGGFVEPQEPLEAAARRELAEETGAEPTHLEQLHTFGDPSRDPRGWTISVAYLTVVNDDQVRTWRLRAGSDAQEVGWFDLEAPPPLAFDHAKILACARHCLRSGANRQRALAPFPAPGV